MSQPDAGDAPVQQTAGDALRARIEADLESQKLELTAKELEFLDRAVDVANSIESLEASLAETGNTVQTPKGLLVNPLVGEVRQQRGQLVVLLKSIDLEGTGASAASAHGKAAANKRWQSHPSRRSANG